MNETNGLTRIIIFYVVLVLAWFGSWLWIGDDVWWLALLNRVIPYLFVPLPLLAGLALIKGQDRLLVSCFVPATIFVFLYWPYLFPKLPTSIPSGGTPVRVMTYNVLYSNNDYNSVAAIIETYQPDLLALQEVQPEIMAELSQKLADLYPFQLMSEEHPYGTTAAFSRYPLLDSYTLDLETDRQAAVLKVEIGGVPVTFISAHMLAFNLQFLPWDAIPEVTEERVVNQARQAEILVETMQNADQIAILACDCNTQETSASYQLLSQSLTNAARISGWRIGAPEIAGTRQDRHLNHIDYVFYTGPARPIQMYTIEDTGGSDHAPMLALLDIPTAEP